MAWCCYMLAVVAVVFSGCFQTVHSLVNITGSPQPGTEAVCDTAECISTAAAIKAKMNLSADPCEDFHNFACGRFLKEYVLPPGQTDIYPVHIVYNKTLFLLHDLIVNTTDPSRPEYVRNMQRLFNSCINETQIEVVGLTPYLNDRAFVDDWPTLNPRWSEAGFDINEVIARYQRAFVSPIFHVTVSVDKTNASKHVIELTQPSLGLHQTYFMKPRNYSLILAYERYLAETAVALNASRVVAEQDARDVVNLEIELSSILVPDEKQRDHTKQNNPVKLNQFSAVYPGLDIARVIRSKFSAGNITLPDDEIVINRFPTYIKDIVSVLECHPKRL